MPLPNVDCTTFLNCVNLYYLLGDEELARPASRPPPTDPRASSSSQPSLSHDYPNLRATLWSIQEEQASLQVYIETKHASLWGFVQERHHESVG